MVRLCHENSKIIRNASTFNVSHPIFCTSMASWSRPLPQIHYLYLCYSLGVSHQMNVHPKTGGHDQLWKSTGLSSSLTSYCQTSSTWLWIPLMLLDILSHHLVKMHFFQSAFTLFHLLRAWSGKAQFGPRCRQEMTQHNQILFSEHTICPTWHLKRWALLRGAHYANFCALRRKIIWKLCLASNALLREKDRSISQGS